MRAGLIAAAAAAALILAGCSSSGSGAGAAKSAGQSVVAENSAAINAAEQLLLTNLQKEIKATPAHPYEAAKRAIADTFPSGNVSKIEQYGVQQFKLTMLHSSAARHSWIHQVVTYALANGGSTASPGTAQIPGTTATPVPAGSTP